QFRHPLLEHLGRLVDQLAGDANGFTRLVPGIAFDRVRNKYRTLFRPPLASRFTTIDHPLLRLLFVPVHCPCPDHRFLRKGTRKYLLSPQRQKSEKTEDTTRPASPHAHDAKAEEVVAVRGRAPVAESGAA